MDAAALEANPLPSDEISLEDFKVNGHSVTYEGNLSVAFRMNDQNELLAFDGENCKQVEINGEVYVFADTPLRKLAFAPSLTEGKEEVLIYAQGNTELSIPLTEEVADKKLKLTDARGKKIKFNKSATAIRFDLDDIPGGGLITLSWE